MDSGYKSDVSLYAKITISDLLNLIKYESDIDSSVLFYCLFKKIKVNPFRVRKIRFSIGNVVNRHGLSLHEGSFDITLTVP